MKDRSLYNLGGICSMLLGISYAVIGVTQLLLPPELSGENTALSPFMYFDTYRGVLMTQYWAMALGAVVALAVVPAVSATVRDVHEGWVSWTSSLATLGFAVTILDNYWAIALTPARAAAYRTGTEAWRGALTVPGAPQFIDVYGYLGYGAVGAWVLVLSLLALRSARWPRPLALLGIAVAIAYLVLVTPILSERREVVQGVAGIGGVILAPIWYIWIGLMLRRTELVQKVRAAPVPVPLGE